MVQEIGGAIMRIGHRLTFAFSGMSARTQGEMGRGRAQDNQIAALGESPEYRSTAGLSAPPRLATFDRGNPLLRFGVAAQPLRHLSPFCARQRIQLAKQ
jgi:hypothetical protein